MTFEDGKGGEVAAKAPSEDADTALVNPALLAEPTGCLASILTLHSTQVLIGHFLEMGTTATCAATVETGHYIAMLCQHVEPIIVAIAVAVGYLLVAGTAIDIEEERILLGGVEIGRQNNIVVQLAAQSGGEGAESFVAGAILGHTFAQVGIVLKGFQQFAFTIVERIDGRGVGIGEGADIIFAVVAETNAVPARFVAQLSLFLPFKIDAIQFIIDGRRLMGEIVNKTRFFIHRADRGDIVGTAGNLSDKLASQVIKVDMVVAILLAGEEHVLAVLQEQPRIGHLHIGLVLLGVEGGDGTCAGISQQQFHFVLQAVHTH